ncbi:MAG: DUF4430 domain-containing protein [Clostridia bacterium]|nr:DUF4430 domain-containing protein [Clostridia bacterium]
MKKTNVCMRLLSLALTLIIVAAMFLFTACGNTNESVRNDGKTMITVLVKGADGKTTDFIIETKEKYLRGALEQEHLVEGEESEFGLYVKFVNGERADYDKDKAYWAIYKEDVYLSTSIDKTPIKDGDIFRFVYTEG